MLKGQSEFILDRDCRLQMLYEINVIENFTQFTGKHYCKSFSFNKVAQTLRFQHMCFPVNFIKI